MSDDRTSYLLEVWKQTVDVQQHFNDLELRIRALAITVIGALLGVVAFTAEEGLVVAIVGLELPATSLVLMAALFTVAAFWFMDRLWYHRLLEGAVAAGVVVEAALDDVGLKEAGLGTHIKRSSPFNVWLFGEIHSTRKADIFYSLLAMSLMLVLGAFLLGDVQAVTPASEGGAALAESTPAVVPR